MIPDNVMWLLIGVGFGWFAGGLAMWHYFTSRHLIRNQQEWEKARQEAEEEDQSY